MADENIHIEDHEEVAKRPRGRPKKEKPPQEQPTEPRKKGRPSKNKPPKEKRPKGRP